MKQITGRAEKVKQLEAILEENFLAEQTGRRILQELLSGDDSNHWKWKKRVFINIILRVTTTAVRLYPTDIIQ